MKRRRKNMRRVLVLFMAMFLALAGYFSYALYFYGNRWFSSSYNPRLQQAKQITIPGRIADRNGIILADSDAEGNRVYAADKATRRAFSHVIGDSHLIISGGVETFHAGELLGFNQGLFSRIQGLTSGNARRGNDIRLTIDGDLQRYVEKAFPSNKDGAVALINYQTGEILALYSSPTLEINDVLEVANGEGSSLVNRATQGRYAPGSIFKTITLAAALDNIPGVADAEYFCEGEREAGTLPLIDNEGKGHGDITLEGAFNISCNLTFGQLGVDMGQAALRRTAEAFGFNDNFLFSDLMVYGSVFPAEKVETGKLAWTSVGQGDLLVSPLHMAMIAGAIGNGGTMMEPKLIAAVQKSGSMDKLLSSNVYRQCVTAEAASALRDYMRSCVTDGTGKRADFKGGTVCGKTGTAQTASSGQGIEPHSWFMGFNDDPEHPLAIAIIIEHGGAGSTHAAPLAGEIMRKAVELLW